MTRLMSWELQPLLYENPKKIKFNVNFFPFTICLCHCYKMHLCYTSSISHQNFWLWYKVQWVLHLRITCIIHKPSSENRNILVQIALLNMMVFNSLNLNHIFHINGWGGGGKPPLCVFFISYLGLYRVVYSYRRFSRALNMDILRVVFSQFWYSITQDRKEKPS